MKKIRFQRGDIFLSRNPMALGRAINVIQQFWATDNTSEYSHAGIILTSSGKTYESLWTVKTADIRDYSANKILVARYKHMYFYNFYNGLLKVAKRDGQIYPFYRLLLHLIPPLARRISFGRVVCSELVAEFLNAAKIPGFEIPLGTNPDTLEERFKRYKDWDIIFEGTL